MTGDWSGIVLLVTAVVMSFSLADRNKKWREKPTLGPRTSSRSAFF